MVKTLRNRLNRIANHEVTSDVTYSVFDNVLTDEECMVNLMTAVEVSDFEDYENIKTIERQYLKLLMDISGKYPIRIVNIKRGIKMSESTDFNDLYLVVTKHVNLGMNALLYIEGIDIVVLLSYDFTVLLYLVQEKQSLLIESAFTSNGFHKL